MTDDRIVYVVTSGEWWDRDTEAVFDNRSGAEAFCEQVDEGKVWEFPLNPSRETDQEGGAE